MSTDTEANRPAVTPRRSPRELSAPVFRDNDSMDEALEAITNRKRPFPVSLEGGWTEHAPLRLPPRSNDTLPMTGKVVVDTPTEPDAQHRRLLDAETTTPPVLPKRRYGVLVALVFLGMALVGAALVAMNNRGAPLKTASPPLAASSATAPSIGSTAMLEQRPPAPRPTASAFRAPPPPSTQPQSATPSTAAATRASAAVASSAPAVVRPSSSPSSAPRAPTTAMRPSKPTKTPQVRGAEFMSEDP